MISKKFSLIGTILFITIIIGGVFFLYTTKSENNDKNNQNQPQEQGQPQNQNIPDNIIDGNLEKIEDGFIYLKEIQRGKEVKKLKLTEKTKYFKTILVEKKPSQFENKSEEVIKKNDFKNGDSVSLMYERNGNTFTVTQLRKIIVE